MSFYYTILVIWLILFSIFWTTVVLKPVTAFKALCRQFSDLFRISIPTPLLFLGLPFRIFRNSTIRMHSHHWTIPSISFHIIYLKSYQAEKRCYVFLQSEILRGYYSLSDREVEINLFFNLNIEPPTSLTSEVYSPQALAAV